MHRFARALVLGSSVALATTVFTACKNDGASACQGHGDCPTVYICRDNACLSTEQSAGTASLADAGPGTACANDNATCTVGSDCCSSVCTNNVCQSASAADPTCTGVSALCQTPEDCCAGLTCTKGVCQ